MTDQVSCNVADDSSRQGGMFVTSLPVASASAQQREDDEMWKTSISHPLNVVEDDIR